MKEREMNSETQNLLFRTTVVKGFRCCNFRHCFISLAKIRKFYWEPVHLTHFSIKLSFSKGITCRLAAAQTACNCLLSIALESQGVLFSHFTEVFKEYEFTICFRPHLWFFCWKRIFFQGSRLISQFITKRLRDWALSTGGRKVCWNQWSPLILNVHWGW